MLKSSKDLGKLAPTNFKPALPLGKGAGPWSGSNKQILGKGGPSLIVNLSLPSVLNC